MGFGQLIMTRLTPIFLFSTLVFIAACKDRSPGTKSEQQSKTEIATSEGIGKPAAPVTVDVVLPPDITPGEPFSVSLVFNSATTAGSLLVELSTKSDLNLIGPNRAEFDLAGVDHRLDTTLIGDATTLSHLNITAREFEPSGAPLMGRSFAIPIAIGASKDALLQQRKADLESALKIIESDGEKLIELPAQIR